METLDRSLAYAVCLAVALSKQNAAAAPRHAEQLLKAMTSKGVVEPEPPDTPITPELVAKIDTLTEDTDRRSCMYVIAEALYSWNFIEEAIMAALRPLADPNAQIPTDEAEEQGD